MSSQRQLHPLVVIEQQLFTRDKKAFFRQFPVNKVHKRWRLIAKLKDTTLNEKVKNKVYEKWQTINANHHLPYKQKISQLRKTLFNTNTQIIIDLPEL